MRTAKGSGETKKFIIFVVISFLIMTTIAIVSYRMSIQIVTGNIVKTKHVTASGIEEAYDIVWIQKDNNGVGTYMNHNDSWHFWKSEYTHIRDATIPGNHVRIKVAGWKLPFYEWYPSIEEVLPDTR